MTGTPMLACGPAYTIDGKLLKRTWARGAVTDYSYTTAGELALVDYADATTPDVAYTYDRLGRIAQVTDGSGTRTFSYDPTTLAQAAETLAMTGAPAPVTLTRNRDSIGRYTGYALTRSGETLTSATYGYDSIGHLTTADNVTFSYEPQSDRVAMLTHALADGRTLVSHTAVEANRGLIDYVSHAVKAPGQPDVLVSKYDYANNAIGQRTGVNRTGTAIGTEQVVSYGYDRLGQVTSAQSTVPAETSAYAYDPIGNRLTSTEGSTPAKTYAANNLNQYTTIEEQQQPFVPAYDLDGNMLDLKNQTGTWAMTWNGENRLVEMTKPDQRLVFAYDYMGRRWKKEVYTGTPGNWTIQSSHRYLYDGFVQITELDARSTYAPTRSYRWDPTVGEATRVLSMTLHGANVQTLAFTHDGNKNTDTLIAADGSLVGHYAYGPFGQVIAATGSLASANPYRFSSEFEDGECGLVYYNYRHYMSDVGRWIKMDPAWESGGFNLYCLTNNYAVIDFLGLLISEGGSEVNDDKSKNNIQGEGKSSRDCVYSIHVAHGLNDSPSLIDSFKSYKFNEMKCGDAVGFWGCSSNQLNSLASKNGHGLQLTPLPPNPFDADDLKKLNDSLGLNLTTADYANSEQFNLLHDNVKEAKTQAEQKCKSPSNCCQSITVRVICSDSIMEKEIEYFASRIRPHTADLGDRTKLINYDNLVCGKIYKLMCNSSKWEAIK